MSKYTEQLLPTMTSFKFINYFLLLQCFLEGNEKGEHSLLKKCLYSEFFWSIFSHIRTEYGDIFCKSPCSVQMRGNMDRKISEHSHVLLSDCHAVG